MPDYIMYLDVIWRFLTVVFTGYFMSSPMVSVLWFAICFIVLIVFINLFRWADI